MFPVRMATLFLSICFIVLLVQLPTIEAYVTAVKSGAEVSVISSGFKTGENFNGTAETVSYLYHWEGATQC